MRNKYAGIALAFGDVFRDDELRQLALPLDGSVARFRAIAERLVSVGHPYSVIVCSAGYEPTSPTVAMEGSRQVSLAGQLGHYVQYHAPASYRDPEFVCKPQTWGTWGEIRHGFRLIASEGYSAGEPVEVFIASHPWHLVRIRIIVWTLKPRAWKVTCIPVNHQFTAKDKFKEVIKILKDGARAVLFRFW